MMEKYFNREIPVPLHCILLYFWLSADMAADYEKTLPAGAAARIAPQDNDLSLVQPEEQEMLTDPSSVFELLNPLGKDR